MKNMQSLTKLIEKQEKLNRLKDCGLPLRFQRQQEFIVDKGNAKAFKLTQRFVAGKINGLFLYGGVGTGKTMLATKILHDYKWESAKFIGVSKLLSELRDTFNTNRRYTTIIDNLIKYELLILDDLGAEKITDWTVEVLYLIVNGRYENMKKLIVTSNCSPKLLSKRLNDRITSRIIEMCHIAKITSQDRRRYAGSI